MEFFITTLPGADTPVNVVGVKAGSDTSTAVTTGVNTAIAGTYGTLTLHADGSYTYQANANTVPPLVTDNFVYTIKDLDGDTSTTTLKISSDRQQPDCKQHRRIG